MTASQREDADELALFAWSPPTNLAAIRESLGTVFQNDGYDYHTGEQYESAANRVLGPHNWSTRVIETIFDEESNEYTILGELTATFWLRDPNDETELMRYQITRQDWGSQTIRRARATRLAQSLGDARKGAMTDFIKRALRQLGFGYYLSEKADVSIRAGTARRVDDDASPEQGPPRLDGPKSDRPRPPAAVKPAAAPPAAAPPAAASVEDQRAFALRLDQAKHAGLPESAWKHWPAPDKMTAIQIERYGSQLDGFWSRQKVGAA